MGAEGNGKVFGNLGCLLTIRRFILNCVYVLGLLLLE